MPAGFVALDVLEDHVAHGEGREDGFGLFHSAHMDNRLSQVFVD